MSIERIVHMMGRWFGILMLAACPLIFWPSQNAGADESGLSMPDGHFDAGSLNGGIPSFYKGTPSPSDIFGGTLAGEGALLCRAETSEKDKKGEEDWAGYEEDLDTVPDPLEDINRFFFQFNDRLYFWVLKPVSTGYQKVVPETLRIHINHFFNNLFMPVRAVNCLLQGKAHAFGDELTRFYVNSTVGFGGFVDIARTHMGIKPHEEDLGQTFGVYGVGPLIYINWPFLGPSTLRDTIGSVGDGFLNPVNYGVDETKYLAAGKGLELVNGTSLRIGEYESMKKAALDPYIAARDAYYQYRKKQIKE